MGLGITPCVAPNVHFLCEVERLLCQILSDLNRSNHANHNTMILLVRHKVCAYVTWAHEKKA